MGSRTLQTLSRYLPLPRLRPGGIALGLGAILLVLAGELAAQTPPPSPPTPAPSDTVRPPSDTVRTPADTAPMVHPDSTRAALGDTIPMAAADTVPSDTLPPVVVAAPLRAGNAPGWAAGVWEWDRAALMRSTALTLNDLLAQIPGVTPVRSGFWGQPEAAALPSGTGGYTEILLDGFALDPLNSSSYDLSRLELVQLSRVRVERRGVGLRIELETVAPTEHQPYSLVEAGTGDYGARLFRGTFMTPDFLVGPLALGIERLEGSGLFGAEPANTFAGWVKWARGFGSTTLQLELRRNTVEWRAPDKTAMKGFRQDWVVRARSALAPGLTTEAFLGGSALEDESAAGTTKRGGLQGGVRAAYQTDRFWSNATLRGRGEETLPGLEADIAAGIRLPGKLEVSGDFNLADWWAVPVATSWGLRAGIEPVTGVRPFVEWSTGTRGVPDLRDGAGRVLLTERDALRAGAELSWRGATLGAAWNRIEADAIADFGLPFDRTAAFYPGGTMQGLELTGRIPLFWEPLRLEGWYTRWSGANPWIYLPSQSWRTALAYHHLPLPSGNLEIDARLELSHRNGMLIPALANPAAGPGAGNAISAVPGLTSVDFYLQIRVMAVHAFVRWNNIAHQLYQQDLPGRLFPGQRAFYGIKWSFWN